MPPSTEADAATGAVDVHCHVFNAQDVPVRKFVELVYLDQNPLGHLGDPLINLIEFIMRMFAPTTREEIDYLTQAALTLGNLRPRGTPQHNQRAVSNALALMWLNSPKDRRWVRQHMSPQLRRRFRGKRNVAVTPAVFQETAKHLLTRDDYISTWIDFALNYTLWRWELTQKLASLSPAQATDVFLYTPAILDIGTRLREPDTSKLSEQVQVMRLISQIKDLTYAVHAYVAFDPFRVIFGDSDDTDILEVVKDAVLKQGAIGVKVYPPMGIKPCNNNEPFADALNKQMKELLTFCLQEDVPILVHCSYSQYVSAKDGACAAPEAWRVFLKQLGHSNLRLNLGHCGGPWDFKKNPNTKTIWTQTVIELLGDPDTYPNVYADVSDDSWILEASASDRANNRKLMRKLSGFLSTNPKARGRLLYGSDWSLLARWPDAENYYPSMKARFGKCLGFTDDETRGYLGGNAVRFLGLAKNPDGSKPKSRVRLEDFRSKYRLEMSLFSKIDALTA